VSHARLSPLDASFLAVETRTAHMHVGWVSLFEPPPDGIGFEEIRAHIAGRVHRVPRFRQRLATVPLGLGDPVWVDDDRFDLDRHVCATTAGDIDEVANAVFSVPLRRDRPLWELWIADGLENGLVGVVGKVHHCMVDGIGALELALLLLDPTPEPARSDDDGWCPAPRPSRLSLLAEGLAERAREQLEVARLPARLLSSPRRLGDAAREAGRVLTSLGDSLRPAPLITGINEPISSDRLLVRARRPMQELRTIADRFGTTINDVVLAVSAGAVGRFTEERGELPVRLKAMVPVNARRNGASYRNGGNQLAYMFVDLPCDVHDPLARLTEVSTATRSRKRAGGPEGAATLMGVMGYIPAPLKWLASRVATSPRTFNLIISNIPGPSERLYMCGCELREAYPVVPLADRHALSIGFTSIRDQACFGLYADRRTLPDVHVLPEDIHDAVDELLRHATTTPPRPPSPTRQPALV
jgi:WS/DGAT/MGAT family acyltransferase